MKTSFSKMKKQVQRGFTLVEIAIVLVIIGLLIGGILRGQELITSARVRNMIDQKSSVQAAYYGFIDRFRMQPGDLTAAQAAQVNNAAAPALIGPGNGTVDWQDSPMFFNNLAQSGFLSCAQCMTALTVSPTVAQIGNTNSPTNVYGAPLVYESALPGNAAANFFMTPTGTTEVTKPKLTTGGQVSSEVLAEFDRKIDDGNPTTGNTRASAFYFGGGTSTPLANCATNAAPNTLPAAVWIVDNPGQCQGVTIF
jgi:prepilin-type N-terminal cleavage/methylation domain-containing protein